VSSFVEAVKPVTLKPVLAGLDAAVEQMDAALAKAILVVERIVLSRPVIQ
jgi:hypothetical protein